jgi:cysteine-rich repeat protein
MMIAGEKKMKTYPWLICLLALALTSCSSGYTPVDAGEEILPDGEDGGEDGGESGCIDAYPGQVLITEIMAEPSAAPGQPGRFIELYNAGFEVLKMEGWMLNDGVAEVEIHLGEETEFLPQTHLVIGFESDPEKNGGLEPELVIAGIDPSRRLLFIQVGDVEVDRVAFDGANWPAETGASLSLDPGKYDYLQNDNPDNWCPGSEAYGDGDLGTPGAQNTACVPPECGNGETEHPEHCDDGKNGDDLDGCRDDCTFTCEDPQADCSDTAGDCHAPACEPNDLGQVCAEVIDDQDPPDDGNQCTYGVCTEGVGSQANQEDGYPCDNSGGLPDDYCKAGVCIEPVCGDDITGPGEQCDDGNNQNGDGCSKDCEFELCGNSELDGEEQCDDGRNGDDLDGCRDDCKYTCSIPAQDCADTLGDCHSPVCVPNALGQVCSEEIDTSDVPDDLNPCTADSCLESGTATHQPLPNGTACDNLAGLSGDYCASGQCIDPVCGDAIPGPLEACDDGDFDACDGCLPTCELHTNTCGDGFTCAPEECDDANDQTGDGCTPECDAESGTCPPDMVLIPADPANGVPDPFCMDIYEASRADAGAASMGRDVNKAVSQYGVIPWFVNPMTARAFEQFQAACLTAGKRICEKEEFLTACSQAGQNLFVFGDTFDREICNCVDTFCDDYCAEHGIDPCSTIANCGYTYYCFHATPTGGMPGCTNDYGTFDICGNAWEIVPSDTDPWGRGYEVRGGAFNCAGASVRLQCTFNASWSQLYAGFRCCRDY